MSRELEALLKKIKDCKVCEPDLPYSARPVVRAAQSARILVIGQAPGTKVHQTGIPWNDPSGDRLRAWMGIDEKIFYDQKRIAIIPMGFCYPGKGKAGDLPPRKECAPLWHKDLLQQLPNISLTLLIGSYAQKYYLGPTQVNLTNRVKNFKDYQPSYFPLPHPSPRNNIWLKKNPWFEQSVVKELKQIVDRYLKNFHIENEK